MKEWLALVASHHEQGLHRTVLHPGELPPVHRGQVFVFALKASDLDAWADSLPEGSVVDRKEKHPARGLSDYLHSKGRHVRLRATYKDTVQIQKGLNALLAASTLRQRTGVLLLGLAENHFAQLYAHAPDAARPEIAPTARPVAGVADPLMDIFHDEFKRAPVSKTLQEEYQGKSKKVDWVRRLIMLAAKCEYPVLIEGETGTGKEIVARQIHENSDRGSMRFLPVNCGGIPEHLLESELFGHIKGAFTSALANKEGMWSLANKGTLFLDEIGDMSLAHQVKVLRALDDGEFIPVGGQETVKSDARIIAATNRDLRKLVAQGRFREDLYYRLYAIHIRTPALRDHPEDIPALAAFLWGGARHPVALPHSPPLPGWVGEELARWPWMGNVRELRAFLMNLAALSNGGSITPPLVHALLNERRRN